MNHQVTIPLLLAGALLLAVILLTLLGIFLYASRSSSASKPSSFAQLNQNVLAKRCPTCRMLAEMTAEVCEECGHKFQKDGLR